MKSNQHTLVLGGARSGKSVFSEELTLRLAAEKSTTCIYLATAQIWDGEMRERVDVHKNRRDESWKTIEAPLELSEALHRIGGSGQPILVDCLTLWLTNLMMAERDVDQAGTDLIDMIGALSSPITFVSNEVGQGIVPENKMAREFRDHAGLLHQKLASAVDTVFFVTAGLPTKLKG